MAEEEDNGENFKLLNYRKNDSNPIVIDLLNSCSF